MTDDREQIRRELRVAGIRHPTEDDIDLVLRFRDAGLFSLQTAAVVVRGGRRHIPLLDRIRRALVDLLSELISVLEPPARP